MRRWILVVCCALGCQLPPPHGGTRPWPIRPPPTAALPDYWLVRINRVQVVPHRVGTEDKWDGPVEQRQNTGAGCALFGALGAVAGTTLASTGGAVLGAKLGSGLCEFVNSRRSPAQRERDPQAPDLFVALATGQYGPDADAYRTFTANDSYYDSFDGYSFIVPSRAIPEQGLALQVMDRDGPEEWEIIDIFPLTQSDLVAAQGQPGHVLVKSSAAVLQLELVAEPAPQYSYTVRYQIPANEGLKIAQEIWVHAGTRLELRAEGEWVIGSWHDKVIGPAGYPGGGPRGRNYQEGALASANHGAAVALVGSRGRVNAVVVPGCIQITTQFEGQIAMGVNDMNSGDNDGTAFFTVSVRPPTVEEWLRPSQVSACR